MGLGIPPYLPQPTNSTRWVLYQEEEKDEALFLYYSELKDEGIRGIREYYSFGKRHPEKRKICWIDQLYVHPCTL